jgi:hypothetical protein
MAFIVVPVGKWGAPGSPYNREFLFHRDIRDVLAKGG